MKFFLTTLSIVGRTFLLSAFFLSAIAFSNRLALADTIKSNTTDTVKQAAREIVKDTGVKEQFGKSKNGDRLLDKAQNKANKKLNKIAETANSNEELPASKKLFLDNLTNAK